jgi:hypothetical protein
VVCAERLTHSTCQCHWHSTGTPLKQGSTHTPCRSLRLARGLRSRLPVCRPAGCCQYCCQWCRARVVCAHAATHAPDSTSAGTRRDWRHSTSRIPQSRVNQPAKSDCNSAFWLGTSECRIPNQFLLEQQPVEDREAIICSDSLYAIGCAEGRLNGERNLALYLLVREPFQAEKTRRVGTGSLSMVRS